MNTGIIVAIIAISVIVGTSIGLYKNEEKNLIRVHELKIPPVDLSSLNDSTYNGSFSYFFNMPYRVAVTVENHRIRKIETTKKYRRKWFTMAEGVLPRVIEAQNTVVDAVSGATTTSKALLMAIHNALVPEEEKILK